MQGFNMGRYVPPDHEGTITSGNRLQGKHPLGQRARKLASHGILTVRFEMPYAIWCLHCPKPTIIGQGVRFNAEKKRAGSYFSTPVWQFRFKHAECGGWIEMRTDPKNTAYVVVEGGKKRDTGDATKHTLGEEGGNVILTDKERDELRNNAFASLEKTIADRKRLEMAADRIEDLTALSERHWGDPYALNQRLRRDFRKGRKQRERDAARAEDIRERMGLGMELVPEVEEDAQRARLVDFGAVEEEDGGERALLKPLFSTTKATVSTTKDAQKQTGTKKATTAAAAAAATSKAEKAASRRKEAFVADVLSNTRAAQDPFLKQRHGLHPTGGSGSGSGSGSDNKANKPPSLGIIKRRKKHGDGGASDNGLSDAAKVPVQPAQGLVEYDSD
ncbi:CWC16 protein [Trichoderma gracile]